MSDFALVSAIYIFIVVAMQYNIFRAYRKKFSERMNDIVLIVSLFGTVAFLLVYVVTIAIILP